MTGDDLDTELARLKRQADRRPDEHTHRQRLSAQHRRATDSIAAWTQRLNHGFSSRDIWREAMLPDMARGNRRQRLP